MKGKEKKCLPSEVLSMKSTFGSRLLRNRKKQSRKKTEVEKKSLHRNSGEYSKIAF